MQICYSILFFVYVVASVRAVCYNDTQDMLSAQVAGETQLEICSGTTLTLGVPISADLTAWSAMTPLVIIKDDVEVYCGADKKSSNNCVFDGGVLQIVTSVFNPLLAGVPTNSTNNLKVSGITFQGNLTDVAGVFGATPVAIGAPGTNIVFDDCIFQDLSTAHVVNLARNQFTEAEDFAPNTADVYIMNSVFRNILFAMDVIVNSAQTLNLNNVSMTNVKYYSSCGCHATVLELNNASTTYAKNVIMKDIETYSSLVRQVGVDTEFNYEALTVENLTFYDQGNREEFEYCAGILKADNAGDGGNVTVECVPLESDKNETSPPPDSASIFSSSVGMKSVAMIAIILILL